MNRPIFFWMLSALLLFSCGNDKSHYELTHEGSDDTTMKDAENSEACRMVLDLLDGKDHQRTLFVVDSLEKAKALSGMAANYYRGLAYSKDKKLRITEWCWQKNMITQNLSPKDVYFYYQSAASLSNLLVNKHNYEGALRIALPAVVTHRNRPYCVTKTRRIHCTQNTAAIFGISFRRSKNDLLRLAESRL